MTIEQVVKEKLAASSAVNAAVSGNIFPEFRDDVAPSLVYAMSVNEVNDTYDSTGPIVYDLSVVAVSSRLADATVLADLVIDAIDGAAWSNSPFRVLGCFYRSRETSYPPVGSKNVRMGMVDLRFDLMVDAATD